MTYCDIDITLMHALAFYESFELPFLSLVVDFPLHVVHPSLVPRAFVTDADCMLVI